MHGSLNLYVVSLVIRLIVFAAIYCINVYWVTHESAICPFWFALTNSKTFHVNMTSVYTSRTKQHFQLQTRVFTSLHSLKATQVNKVLVKKIKLPHFTKTVRAWAPVGFYAWGCTLGG